MATFRKKSLALLYLKFSFLIYYYSLIYIIVRWTTLTSIKETDYVFRTQILAKRKNVNAIRLCWQCCALGNRWESKQKKKTGTRDQYYQAPVQIIYD